ncbi:MAG: deoxyribodipyrimidine photo-lyase [Acidimicrobiia bacterium]|jgi:deoxyribodipyrimidine photo-lyase
MTNVFWFRRDARLDDNPGLEAACKKGKVAPLFVIDPGLFDRCSPRRRTLLLGGLADLDRQLSELGGRLRVESGQPAAVVSRVAAEVGAESVHISREVTPYGTERDQGVAKEVNLVPHDAVYARPPGSVLTGAGEPYKVFTPFYRSWSERDTRPFALPDGVEFTDEVGAGLPSFAGSIVPAGTRGAEERLQTFQERVDTYQEERDRIDLDSTSHVSVDLKYGWIGPRRLISEIGTATKGRQAFVRQLAWRDFYGHLLAEYPRLPDESFDDRYRGMEWRNDPDDIAAWKEGRTGYPIIDAAMRRLVEEGQMHNRARLLVGSFLVKDLLVDWRIGERFFRHHLVDGDVAQNAGNWQWVAGTGTDAAPYFRVFNPVTQSKKFDPDGWFIRKWVPELAEVPDQWIHSPWEAGPIELLSYGVELGRDYPGPLVDHSMARQRALDAYEAARGSR